MNKTGKQNTATDSWHIWPNGDPKKQLDKQSFRDGEKLTDVQRKYAIVTEYTKKF